MRQYGFLLVLYLITILIDAFASKRFHLHYFFAISHMYIYYFFHTVVVSVVQNWKQVRFILFSQMNRQKS